MGIDPPGRSSSGKNLCVIISLSLALWVINLEQCVEVAVPIKLKGYLCGLNVKQRMRFFWANSPLVKMSHTHSRQSFQSLQVYKCTL
jgi:hypothetical protein